MTNKNISSLTAATTPLAGTETIPVWDGATKKVAVDDLTVKNIRSNATSGILQIEGPAAASTRVVTVPNADWTAARTDAAQSFTGDQTLATGNLVQGTATKGINFTANTPAAGMTSQLLNWYEEGTFTFALVPGTSGTLTLNASYNTLTYTRVGRQITVQGAMYLASVSAPVGTYVRLTGLPFTSRAGIPYSYGGSFYKQGAGSLATGVHGATIAQNSNEILLRVNANGLAAASDMAITFTYFI